MSALWDLVSRQRITPTQLQAALTAELKVGTPCFRTCQLIHESSAILERRFGIKVDTGDLPPPETRLGFPNLAKKVGLTTSPETIKKFLRELGAELHEAAEITVAGSSSLILQGLLLRHTREVAVVDEVPQALHSLKFHSRTDLIIAHFQSHYLPQGWMDRRNSLGDFGKLRVYLVNGLDIYVGKLFSLRAKDQSDLHHLQQHFDKDAVQYHLAQFGNKLLADPKLGEAARKNWYIEYGEQLPES